MPELPDVLLYLHALRPRVVGQAIARVRLASPFLLRSVEPPLDAVQGRTVVDLERLGKRIVFTLDDDLFIAIHLMIAGRFRWRAPGAAVSGKVGLLAVDFEHGTLLLTEAGTKRRASLHVVRGRDALAHYDPGGLDVLGTSFDAFDAALRRENHTLKRALTDPRILSGIGNAYSDEVLHAARLSPFRQTGAIGDEDMRRLHQATRDVLTRWTTRLQDEAGDAFPEKVTAFHPGMAVHGRYGQPCPVCGTPIQRVVYASNEANYCVQCQTGGRLLADRALSRLLREDWPRTLEDLEQHKATRWSDAP
ncbi:MAG: formamidopyrimidine-DNA glycosylase [Acidobacteria bacterium]|nr:formamidopyrimidine-DNA glycosylase [Acidobacteriota bacterium]